MISHSLLVFDECDVNCLSVSEWFVGFNVPLCRVLQPDLDSILAVRLRDEKRAGKERY